MKVFQLLLLLWILITAGWSDNIAGFQCDQPGWTASAIEHIKSSEYEPSIQERDADGMVFEHPRVHFANRTQNLRAYFDENGLELSARVESPSEWRLALNVINEISPGKPYIEGNSVKYENENLHVEYRNTESGLHQSISVGNQSETSGLVSLIIGLDARNLSYVLKDDGIVFHGNDNEIEYTLIDIKNINGESVSFSLNLDFPEFVIIFREVPNLYPIAITGLIKTNEVDKPGAAEISSIDGLSSSPDWYVESDQADSYMGYQVNTAGDVNGDSYSDVIIGVSYYDNGQTDEGRAYVYHGSAGGLSSTPDWTVESDQAYSYFGISVASAGDVNGDGFCDVIIGATYYDNGNSNEGMAFVYHGSASGLSTTANWTGEPDQDNARYGYGVGTAGDVNGDGYSDIAVGAPGYNGGQSGEGRAYVYHGSSGGLSTTPSWTAEGDLTNALYGCYVASAGDVNGDGYGDAIIGARQYSNGQSYEGRAFAYHGSSGGLSSSADWYVESDQADAQMGNCVASAGDVNGDGYSDVLVGSYFYDGGQTNEGKVFLYYGSSGGLSGSPDWSAESDQDSAWFGWVAGSAGDINGDGFSDVIIGAPYFDNGQTNEGYAWLYYGSGSGLPATADWTAECDQAGARFGVFVSTAGDVNGDGYSDVLIGADWFDNVETDEGRVFAYYGSADGVADSACWVKYGSNTYDWFGTSVSDAGDVNGDGYADVIIGAQWYDNGQTDEGGAFVFHGSAAGLSSAADWTGESDQTNAEYGFSVSSAGDVNNDGYSDVVIGAHRYTNVETNEGRTYVYHGSATGLSSTANWTAESDQAGAEFGTSVSSAGDINGDGYSDVIIGAPYYDNGAGEDDEGRAYVYNGSEFGLSGSPSWTDEANLSFAYYGISVSNAGDVNGDGYSDVVIGAKYYSNTYSFEGRAYAYHGSSSGLSTTPDWTKDGGQEWAEFGNSVCTAGDINGDGYSDAIIGARAYTNESQCEGRAYIFNGSSSGLSPSASWTVDPCDQDYAYFGQSVHTAGDVNGDGYSDIIVGAHQYTNGDNWEGIAYCYYGSTTGLATSLDWSKEGNSFNAIYGHSVSTAGDINGDGYSDIVIGAPGYSISGEEGAIYVYYGNSSDGVNVLPRQAAPDDSRHVQLLNGLDYSGLGVKMRGYTPAGRGKVKVEWQVREFGQPFNDVPDSQSISWYDTGVNGVEIIEEAYLLSVNQAYKWRARLLYSPLNYQGAVHSRWLSWGPNGWNEADFKNTETIDVEESEFIPRAICNFMVMPTISAKQFKFSFNAAVKVDNACLNIYDISGRLVKTLYNGTLASGYHEFQWAGTDDRSRSLANGIYFVRLEGEALTRTQKLLLIK